MAFLVLKHRVSPIALLAPCAPGSPTCWAACASEPYVLGGVRKQRRRRRCRSHWRRCIMDTLDSARFILGMPFRGDAAARHQCPTAHAAAPPAFAAAPRDAAAPPALAAAPRDAAARIKLKHKFPGLRLGDAVSCVCSPRLAEQRGGATTRRSRAPSGQVGPVKAGPKDEGRYISPSETTAGTKPPSQQRKKQRQLPTRYGTQHTVEFTTLHT